MRRRVAVLMGLLILCLLLVPVGVAWWSSSRDNGPKPTTEHGEVMPPLQRPSTEESAVAVVEVPAHDPWDPHFWLQGEVVSSVTGDPVPGASVAVLAGMHRVPVARTVTDDDGQFRLDERPPLDSDSTSLMFLASAPSFGARYFPLDSLPWVASLGRVRIELTPGVRIAGRVTSASSAPLSFPNATLLDNVRLDFGIYDAEVRSPIQVSRDGSFVAYATGDWFAVAATASRCATTVLGPIRVSDPTRESLAVELETGSALVGRVVDIFGDPVEGAVVTVRAPESTDRPCFNLAPDPAVTDASGEFRFLGFLPHCMPRFFATAKGYDPGFGSMIPTSHEVQIVLEPSRRLTLSLRTAAGPLVGLQNATLAADFNQHFPLTPDQESYVTDQVNSYYESVEIAVPGYWPVEVDLPQRQTVVDLGSVQLQPATEVSIRVSNSDGDGVPGAIVAWCYSQRRNDVWSSAARWAFADSVPRPISDAAGQVTIPGLPPGDHDFAVYHPEYSRLMFSLPVPEKGPLTHEVTLLRGCTVVLHLPGAIPGLRVQKDHVGPDFTHDRSIEIRPGRVRLSALAPDERTEIELTAPAHATTIVDVPPLSAGETRVLDVTMPKVGEHELTVRVVDEGLNPLAEAQVFLQLQQSYDDAATSGEDRRPRGAKVIDATGAAVWADLRPGSYLVEASTRRHHGAEMELDVTDDTEAVLTLSTRELYTPRLVFDNGQPVVGARVSWSSDSGETAYSDDRGSVELPIYDDDVLSLEIDWGAYEGWVVCHECTAPVDLPAVIELPRGTDLRLEILEEDGTPLAGIREITVIPDDPTARCIFLMSINSDHRRCGPGQLFLEGVPAGPALILACTEHSHGSVSAMLFAHRTTTATVVVKESTKRVATSIIVSEPSGSPIKGASVVVVGPGSTYRGFPTTDEYGEVMAYLRNGVPTTIRVHRNGYHTRSVAAVGGTGSIDVTLQPE